LSYTPSLTLDYERREELEETQRTLEKINEPMRSALLLKQQGLLLSEIAERLSINESNVGSLIARGRKEFVRLYGNIGGRTTSISKPKTFITGSSTGTSISSTNEVLESTTFNEQLSSEDEAAISVYMQELDGALGRMQQTQTEIEALQKETREILTGLQAA
jgi:hypothetical protein